MTVIYVTVKCVSSVGIDSSLELKVCIDDSLKHVIAVLEPKLSSRSTNLEKLLEDLKNTIKQCCGEEFNIVKLDSRPSLVKVIIATEEGMDKSIMDTVIRLLEEKLKKCELGNKLGETSKTADKKQTTRTKSGGKRKSS